MVESGGGEDEGWEEDGVSKRNYSFCIKKN